MNFTRSRLNDVLMWFVLLLVFIVPFMLGGNRPLVWVLVAFVLSCVSCVYFVILAVLDVSPALPLRKIMGYVAVMAIFSLYLVFQILPVAPLLPEAVLSLPRGIVSGLTISVAPGDTVMTMVRWYSIFVLFYLVLQCTANTTRAKLFLTALFWIVVMHAVFGFFMFYEMGDTILFVEKWSYHGSMTGGFVNRNSFATFLASGAAIGLASIVVRSLTQSQKPTSSFLFLDMTSLLSALGWLVIFAALARTNSRMGLFVGLLGLGILSMYFVSKSASSRFGRVFRFASAAVLLVGLVTLIVTFYGLSTLERLGSTESSVDVRTQLYEQVWGMIMQRPLTGYGGGTFETSYPLFHQLPVSVDLVWDKAHNTYLALLVDYGLIFGSLPILVVLLMVLKILTMLWRSEKPDFIILSTVVVVCIASVHALFDFSFEIQGYALLFTAVLATGVSRMYTDTKRPVRHSR